MTRIRAFETSMRFSKARTLPPPAGHPPEGSRGDPASRQNFKARIGVDPSRDLYYELLERRP